jgi:hypothetical protein
MASAQGIFGEELNPAPHPSFVIGGRHAVSGRAARSTPSAVREKPMESPAS